MGRLCIMVYTCPVYLIVISERYQINLKIMVSGSYLHMFVDNRDVIKML